MLKPLNRSHFLSSQKYKQPKYYTALQSSSGRKLQLADPRVNRLALALMDMQSVLGGAASHWGGPSGFAEIVSALYALVFSLANEKKINWYELFHIINDAGHCENGLYALKANYGLCGLDFSSLKGFRSINSPLTGHGEAHLFPEGVYLSNGPLGSTVAQAEGICMADKLSGNNRYTVALISDGACMEGEAKEALSSIPGFTKKNKLNPFIAIISDNNTKLSGRIDEDSFSLDPFLKSLETQGWELINLNSAHNLQKCVDTLEKILTRPYRDFSRPVCIRAKTIKGFGVKTTQQSASGGHGFPLKTPEHLLEFLEEIYGSKDIPEEFINWYEELKTQFTKKSPVKTPIKKIKIQTGISKAMIHCFEKELPIVSISADLPGSTGVQSFRQKYPEHSFDMGVAEANMISVGAGFSKQGFIPIVDTFTQFGVTKGALPLLMANLSLAPVIAILSHAGLQDAADGASHQSLTYLAQTTCLPRTNVHCLSSAEEAFHLLTQAIESFSLAYKNQKIPKTHIFFLGRETFSPSYLPENHSYQLGQAQILYSSLQNKTKHQKSLTLLAIGPLLEQAITAGQKLQEQNWNVIVLNPSSIQPLDMKTIIDCLKKTNHQLLTVEDHYLNGRMGSLLAHQLALKNIPVNMKSLAVTSNFGRSAYKANDLYKKERLSAEDIISTAFSCWS